MLGLMIALLLIALLAHWMGAAAVTNAALEFAKWFFILFVILIVVSFFFTAPYGPYLYWPVTLR